jgi:hypothetical protein
MKTFLQIISIIMIIIGVFALLGCLAPEEGEDMTYGLILSIMILTQSISTIVYTKQGE